MYTVIGINKLLTAITLFAEVSDCKPHTVIKNRKPFGFLQYKCSRPPLLFYSCYVIMLSCGILMFKRIFWQKILILLLIMLPPSVQFVNIILYIINVIGHICEQQTAFYHAFVDQKIRILALGYLRPAAQSREPVNSRHAAVHPPCRRFVFIKKSITCYFVLTKNREYFVKCSN